MYEDDELGEEKNLRLENDEEGSAEPEGDVGSVEEDEFEDEEGKYQYN